MGAHQINILAALTGVTQMQPTIIALRGRPNSGKSTTLKLVFEQLQSEGDLVWQDTHRYVETVAVVKVGDVKVGIVSIGDVADLLNKLLQDVMKRGCLVIVCACRRNNSGSDSKTVQVVKRCEPGYSIVWIDKEQTATESDQREANKRSCNEVLRAVKKVIKNN